MSEVAIEWVVTWLWQASILTLLVTGALKLASGLSAATRFVVWWAALLAVLALAPLSMSQTGWVETGLQPAGHLPETVLSTQSVDSHPEVANPVILLPRPPVWLVSGLALLWAASASRRLVGFARDLVALARAKRRSVPVSRQLERQLHLWNSVRGRGRRTRLCVSEQVSAASMLGFRTPVIAISRRMVESLNRDELDRIVLHEFGHVQRRDDWTGAAQVIVEALFAWHPAVWWIGRQLHLEREVASDDWVVARTATPRAYASCLAKVARLARTSTHPALAQGAMWPRRTLTVRVKRLLSAHRSVTTRPTRAAVAVGVAGIAVTSTALGLMPPVLGTLQGNGDEIDPLPASALTAVLTTPADPGLALSSALSALGAADSSAGSTTQPPSAEGVPIPEVALADLPLAPLPAEPRPPDAVVGEVPRLASTSLRLDIAPPPIPVGVGSLRRTSNIEPPGKKPWDHVASVGRTVGDRATRASRATAFAVRDAAVSIAKVFRR